MCHFAVETVVGGLILQQKNDPQTPLLRSLYVKLYVLWKIYVKNCSDITMFTA